MQKTILLIQIGAYAVLLIIILFACSKEIVPPELDGDLDPIDDEFAVTKEAQEEKERVGQLIENGGQRMDGLAASDVLIVHNLVKKYYTAPPVDEGGQADDRPTFASEREADETREREPPNRGRPEQAGFAAVKGTSFGVSRGEVFSLLGVNGAGKSSTFKCLAAQTRVSGGTVMIDGMNVNEYVGKPQALHGLIGYCPQTNNFDGALTVKQSITLLARLNGVVD